CHMVLLEKFMKNPFSTLAAASILALPALLASAEPDPANWQSVVSEARGQTDYWNAWGGDPQINDYIAWAGDAVAERFGVTSQHVKLSDTAAAVSTVLSEMSAGKDAEGSIDLIWI